MHVERNPQYFLSSLPPPPNNTSEENPSVYSASNIGRYDQTMTMTTNKKKVIKQPANENKI